ncbi:hypothetical protein QTN25_010646 [Entamoeba marina]
MSADCFVLSLIIFLLFIVDTEYTSNMSDSGQSSECFEYEYGNFKTDFSPLEQTVMQRGKVDERDIIYTKREFGVFLDFLEFIMTEAHEMLPFLFEDLDKREVIATAALVFNITNIKQHLYQDVFFFKVGRYYFKRHFSKFFYTAK